MTTSPTQGPPGPDLPSHRAPTRRQEDGRPAHEQRPAVSPHEPSLADAEVTRSRPAPDDGRRTTGRPHVVVVGSGFGGLFATRHLAKADVDVTLVSRTSHHLFQPLLYQVATGILSEGDIAPSTREVLSGQTNATVLLGEVTDIDLDSRCVRSQVLDSETVTTYDHLVVAAGAGQSYFGNDHFALWAPGMKSIDDALELRGRIFGAFELAELAWDEAETARMLTFVVVGAGPTGVEMAGQIAELSRQTLRRDFRRIDPTSARVVLVDAAPKVLPGFDDSLGRAAHEQLEKMGVDVQLGAMVVGVDRFGLDVKDSDGTTRRIDARCKVWAAGVQASALGAQLAEQSGAELDRSGRVKVEPDLTLPGHPEVHVVGDMMALEGLPGVAQVAIQGGEHAAREIRRSLAGEATGEPFRYKDKGSMATIARFSAVADVGGRKFSGFVAWVLWLAVHLLYLVGFKNRVTTLLKWTITFVGRGRSERAVTQQQIIARRALAQRGQDAATASTTQAAPTRSGTESVSMSTDVERDGPAGGDADGDGSHTDEERDAVPGDRGLDVREERVRAQQDG
ncbi:NAD(P)/FAD-dependent oxidoreductase [Aquipuribacter nitratireducens]|uniref:NADH:ubiquinone reductase (non-electrogenic) n=1 Tax=Aquipuribacter nitratireducens TaxID=650104 RepID=A0ABW0GN36_9MICO